MNIPHHIPYVYVHCLSLQDSQKQDAAPCEEPTWLQSALPKWYIKASSQLLIDQSLQEHVGNSNSRMPLQKKLYIKIDSV